MDTENTHVTLACPKCGQGVETTLEDISATPLVICGACGEEFTAQVESMIEEE